MERLNHEPEYINSIKSQLNEIIRKKDEALLKVEELEKQVSLQEPRLRSLQQSEQESNRIAAELESQARAIAEGILAEAEAVVASHKAMVSELDQEIALLLEELDTYQNPAPYVHPSKQAEVSHQTSSRVDMPLTAYTECFIEHIDSGNETSAPINNNHPTTSDNTIYNMKLISFVNARHFVMFGGKTGPIHAHSWQVEIEVEVPRAIQETVEFSIVFKAVTSALQIYENTILNNVYPFQFIQPTTENIAMNTFNRLDEVISEMGLKLVLLNLWETPTRGIRVNQHNRFLDEEIHLAVKNAEDMKLEIAAISESNFDGQDTEETEIDKDEISIILPSMSLGPLRPPISLRQYLWGILLISAIAVLAYHNILWPSIEHRYPWGSDTWGHLFKAEMLFEQILKGNYYPQFTEYWYNGTQPFRYWAPLPYYFLAMLRAVSGDIFVAGNLYIFICALFGGLSWLLLARRMGLWPSIMAGLIWLLWQDNVRVAFSEGNLPRVLATALLPLLFAVFLEVLANRKSYRSIIATILIIHLIVLCHAMIAAVYCVCLVLFAFFLWVFQGSDLKGFLQGTIVLIVGLISASWWLLPSLSGGGIAAIDAQAVKEIVQFVSASISLNPVYRFTNIETYYWGLSLIVALLITIIAWKSKPAWAKSLTIVGIILVVISFPIIRPIYISLPLSHLLWPLRFSSFAALAILAAAFTFKLEEDRQAWLRSSFRSGLLLLCLCLFLLMDCFLSFRLLAHCGTMPFTVIQSGEYIQQKPGWRVATIDLSELGSAPSYAFSELSGLEQVFGWAWQGAVTSQNIMLLNTGLEQQYYPFLFRSCVNLGATDLVVKEDVVTDMEAFRSAANMAGYQQYNKFAGISVWRNIGKPYLVVKKAECMVIGKYAGTVALQFPEVEMALSPFIDGYSLNELQEYSTLILSGASWHSKKEAEKLIRDYVAWGGKVYIEMAGMPENVLAKQPEFLGVYGQPVNVRGEIEVLGQGKRYVLPPVWQQAGEWRAYVPMGLDHVELAFSYYGNQAPILGYKLIEGHKVWFLGYNLSYHTYRSGTPEGTSLLKGILDLSTTYSGSKLISLQDYEVNEDGYRMSFQMDQNAQVIVPVSKMDGMQATLDGKEVPMGSFENLVELRLPAGEHQLVLKIKKTPVYIWGKYVSLLSALIMLIGFFYVKRAGDKD